MIEIIDAVNVIITSLKNLHELSEKERYAEVKKGIADMSAQLSDMKIAAYEIKDENTELKEEIKRLKSLSERELTKKNGLYYDKDGDGPYCPTCWDNDKRIVLMGKLTSDMPYVCSQCRTISKR
jgi:hypothetical protein